MCTCRLNGNYAHELAIQGDMVTCWRKVKPVLENVAIFLSAITVLSAITMPKIFLSINITYIYIELSKGIRNNIDRIIIQIV